MIPVSDLDTADFDLYQSVPELIHITNSLSKPDGLQFAPRKSWAVDCRTLHIYYAGALYTSGEVSINDDQIRITDGNTSTGTKSTNQAIKKIKKIAPVCVSRIADMLDYRINQKRRKNYKDLETFGYLGTPDPAETAAKLFELHDQGISIPGFEKLYASRSGFDDYKRSLVTNFKLSFVAFDRGQWKYATKVDRKYKTNYTIPDSHKHKFAVLQAMLDGDYMFDVGMRISDNMFFIEDAVKKQ